MIIQIKEIRAKSAPTTIIKHTRITLANIISKKCDYKKVSDSKSL